MSKKWYNQTAKRIGGYKSPAKYTIDGLSPETIFEDMLIKMLGDYDRVLDIGCGHGEFTLKMASYANRITGVDNAGELLKIANRLKESSKFKNIDFKFEWTKKDMSFKDNTFDLIYSRRGPTSIVNHSRILKSGGKLIGIHTLDLDMEAYSIRLLENGFKDIEYKIYTDAYYIFENKEEFAKHLSSNHMQKDYTKEENQEELELIVDEHVRDGKISYPQHRIIWQAIKE
jgi:ubiquinone/menaquinone biosynthesis C-methylase UbiE